MKFCALMVVACLMISCATLRTEDAGGVAIDPRVRAEQETEIQKAEKTLETLDYQNSEKQFAEFQKKFPTSIFYQRAQFGLAKSLEGQEHWAEAAELYRRTVEATRERQPEIAAQALYEISYCYENLGDEARVLASLQDALRLKEHLTAEQALAEIPARMAASYNRMGRIEEADRYFRQAEQGIHQVRAGKDPQKSAAWLSETYYHMGVFSTNQISYENLQPSLDTLKMVQTFSLRSAEAGGEPWSKMASKELMANYRDLWNTVQQIPMNKAMDPGAAKREQADRQVSFAGQILTLINELKTYRSPEPSEESAEAQELFTFLAKIEKQAQDLLYSLREQNPLTPDAEKRGGLKK